jgi:hypothetical protein
MCSSRRMPTHVCEYPKSESTGCLIWGHAGPASGVNHCWKRFTGILDLTGSGMGRGPDLVQVHITSKLGRWAHGISLTYHSHTRVGDISRGFFFFPFSTGPDTFVMSALV